MSFRKVALGAVSALAMAWTPMASNAEVIQLGFILDESGSIGSGNWTTIVTGLSNAINTLIPVGGTDTYEVTVVSFSTGATTVVDHVLITDAATRTSVANDVANKAFAGGSTNFAAAFSQMQSVLTASSSFSAPGKSYVNFATDGVPNDNTAGMAARDALIAAGIDNISIEGIGGGVNASNLQSSYCYPGPCDLTSPYNFPTQGFYIGVADAAGYAAAIGNKILVVTNQTPEPGTLALVGLAAAGVGFARRRQQS